MLLEKTDQRELIRIRQPRNFKFRRKAGPQNEDAADVMQLVWVQ